MEKLGENVKQSGILKFVHNSLKLFLFQIIITIFKINSDVFIFIVKYVQNSRTLNDFNEIIKIYISIFL